MTPKEVINYFGGIVPTAAALNCTRQAVYIWLQRKKIPEQRAYQIQVVTNGALKVGR